MSKGLNRCSEDILVNYVRRWGSVVNGQTRAATARSLSWGNVPHHACKNNKYEQLHNPHPCWQSFFLVLLSATIPAGLNSGFRMPRVTSGARHLRRVLLLKAWVGVVGKLEGESKSNLLCALNTPIPKSIRLGNFPPWAHLVCPCFLLLHYQYY